jgi:hypothetical protein
MNIRETKAYVVDINNKDFYVEVIDGNFWLCKRWLQPKMFMLGVGHQELTQDDIEWLINTHVDYYIQDWDYLMKTEEVEA